MNHLIGNTILMINCDPFYKWIILASHSGKGPQVVEVLH